MPAPSNLENNKFDLFDRSLIVLTVIALIALVFNFPDVDDPRAILIAVTTLLAFSVVYRRAKSKTPLIRVSLALCIAVSVVSIVFVLNKAFSSSDDRPNPMYNDPSLKVAVFSEDQIEVSWDNLLSTSNVYLMTGDRHWYYNQFSIKKSSGKERIARGNHISVVAIVEVNNRLKQYLRDDPNIKVILEETLP